MEPAVVAPVPDARRASAREELGTLVARLLLSERANTAHELMDADDADLAALERTYAQFHLVNAAVSRQRRLYRRWIRPRAMARVRAGSRGATRSARPLRVLDVGTGGADVPRALLGWARADGVAIEVTGIDPDERALDWARRRPSPPGLELRSVTSEELARRGEQFDVVISNHVLHHLDGHEFGALLADSERLVAPGGVAVHADIERSPLALAGFTLGTLPFASTLLSGSFIRADGLTSIRRSHRAVELAPFLPEGWRVHRTLPFRLEVVWELA